MGPICLWLAPKSVPLVCSPLSPPSSTWYYPAIWSQGDPWQCMWVCPQSPKGQVAQIWRGRTQTVFELVKDGKWVIFFTIVGFLAVSRQGLLVLRLWKDPWIRYFHNSFKQGSLVDSYTSCPGCKGWCGRRWQPASSFWCQIALSSLTWAISQVCSLCVIQPSTAALQKYFRVLQTKEKVEVGTPQCVRNVRASG